MAGAILAIPSGRGSCMGSAILLDLLTARAGPAAIIFREEGTMLADSGSILTNSGKYVHYCPGPTGRTVRFASLAACVEAAASGQFDPKPPAWLAG